ncbi:MAG TPA: hypothetical protein VKA34_10405 [Balneolales bacterium]|nr:hypothetical protein [Balneolales bacterium]
MKKVILSTMCVLLTISFAIAQTTANVEQTGKSNTLNIGQTGNNQNAIVNQEGNSGEINITQVSYNDEIQNANVDQKGHGNFATIHQIKYDANVYEPDYASIKQRGKMNSASIVQNASGSDSGQKSEIDQHGKQNISKQVIDEGQLIHQYIKQHRFNNRAEQTSNGYNLSASINQDGKYNEAYQVQNGAFNLADVIQSGTYNKSYQTQFGKGQASVTQSGNWNTSNILQQN